MQLFHYRKLPLELKYFAKIAVNRDLQLMPKKAKITTEKGETSYFLNLFCMNINISVKKKHPNLIHNKSSHQSILFKYAIIIILIIIYQYYIMSITKTCAKVLYVLYALLLILTKSCLPASVPVFSLG